jgi:hypothetical protein
MPFSSGFRSMRAATVGVARVVRRLSSATPAGRVGRGGRLRARIRTRRRRTGVVAVWLDTPPPIQPGDRVARGRSGRPSPLTVISATASGSYVGCSGRRARIRWWPGCLEAGPYFCPHVGRTRRYGAPRALRAPSRLSPALLTAASRSRALDLTAAALARIAQSPRGRRLTPR